MATYLERALLSPNYNLSEYYISLKDEFSIADAAPLDASTKASGTDHRGTLEKVTDGSNTASISGGRFLFSGAAAATYRFEPAGNAPINGDFPFAIHFLYQHASGNVEIGLYDDNAASADPRAGIYPLDDSLQIKIDGTVIESYPLTTSTDYEIVIDYDGSDTRWLIKGGTEYPTWVEIYRTQLIVWGSKHYFCAKNTNAVIEFDNIRVERTYTFDTSVTRYPTFYVSTTGADTFDPDITTSSGTATWQYGDGSADEVTNSVSHAISGAVDMLVRLTDVSVGNILTLSANSDKLTGDITPLWFEGLVALTSFNVAGNSLAGSLANWILPDTLQSLTVRSNTLGGDISNWEFPENFTSFNGYNNVLSGDIAGWVLPAAMTNMSINTNDLRGDLSFWVLPATLVFLYLHTNNFDNCPNDFSPCPDINQIIISNNNLSQSNVDFIIDNIYTNRTIFTITTPTLTIGGTNAAPSGAYQIPPDCDTVIDGKEQIYELVNDSCGDGHNTWVVNYTA